MDFLGNSGEQVAFSPPMGWLCFELVIQRSASVSIAFRRGVRSAREIRSGFNGALNLVSIAFRRGVRSALIVRIVKGIRR